MPVHVNVALQTLEHMAHIGSMEDKFLGKYFPTQLFT